MPDSAIFQTLFFALVVNARLSLTPGTVAPEMERYVSVLTAVLLLHENTDHVTGIHKSNKLYERRGKAIIRTHWTLIKLLVQCYIKTGTTAKFKNYLLPFPVLICKFQCKWSQTAKLETFSLLLVLHYILKSFPIPTEISSDEYYCWVILVENTWTFDVQLLLTFLCLFSTSVLTWLCPHERGPSKHLIYVLKR